MYLYKYIFSTSVDSFSLTNLEDLGNISKASKKVWIRYRIRSSDITHNHLCYGPLALLGADPPSSLSFLLFPPSVLCVCGREHQLCVPSQKQAWLPQFLLHT